MSPAVKANLPLVAALAALALLLLALEAARPGYFLHDDNATWFAAAYAHDFRVLTETGRIAEVNFYQYGGEPFIGQGQTAVLYPPVYLGEALARLAPGDPRWSIEWIAALHLALGVAGFYFWMRHAGIAPEQAALAGLVWALNPFVLILGASWIMVTYVAAWLPWLFWAIEHLFAKPAVGPALALGTILGLFLLQGYVQWVVYAALFAGMYALYLLVTTPGLPRGRVLLHLVLAALVFGFWTAPLLAPMLAAVAASAARAHPVSLWEALFYRVQLADLLRAQAGLFRPGFMFGLSTAIFFSPALLLAPLAVIRFFLTTPELRRRLFPMIVLGIVALVLSGWGHVLLNLLPFVEKFRWPFKVFLFADFFLVAAFVRALATLAPRWKNVAAAALGAVLLAQLGVALAQHDSNFISKTALPTSENPLPAAMDPTLGRVIAIDDHLPETDSPRYFTHGYATYFQVPALGGYDPLVSRDSLAFALGLDFPNVFTAPITPPIRAQLESRAVRYWIVDPNSPRGAEVESLDGLKLLAAEPDRLIYEDTRAQPMAFADSAPMQPLPLTYAGNSVLIRLDHLASTVHLSLGPGDGWHYRLDSGPWRKPEYRDDRVVIPVPESARLLEVSFFDPSLHEACLLDLQLLASLSFILLVSIFLKRGLRR
jgi:hypothetical protein